MKQAISRHAGFLKRVLFLCPDNHSLGRFCEEYFNSVARTEGLNWQAASRAAGHFAPVRSETDTIDPAALDALRQLRAAPVNHRRAPLAMTWRDVTISDIVIGIALKTLASASHGRSQKLLDLPMEHWSPRQVGDALWCELSGNVIDLVNRLDTYPPRASLNDDVWHKAPAGNRRPSAMASQTPL